MNNKEEELKKAKHCDSVGDTVGAIIHRCEAEDLKDSKNE